jgi:MerR family transcriptional regulator, copper efflux regulator
MAAPRTLHQIGAVAERVGLSLRTIRHYEEVGLVVPSGRSPGGFRLYTDADIERLEQVKVMKPLGFSLEETTEILELRRARHGGTLDAGGRQRLNEYLARAEERIGELDVQLGLARSFTGSVREELGSTESSTGTTDRTQASPGLR